MARRDPKHSSDLTLINTIVAACSRKTVLAIPARINKCRLSLAVDTGACVNVMSETSFTALKRQFRGSQWKLKPSDLNISAVEGSRLTILGIVTLPIRLTRQDHPFKADFYVVKQFALPCVGLLGLDSLAANGIDVPPKLHAITCNGCTFPAMTSPEPLLSCTPVAASAFSATSLSQDDSVPCKPSDSATCSVTLSEHSQSVSHDWPLISASLIGDQLIPARTTSRVPGRLDSVPSEGDVVCLSETNHVNRLAVESTLSTIRDGNITDALVVNTSTGPTSIKQGTFLAKFQAYDKPMRSEPLDLPVASLTTSEDTVPSQNSDVREQLRPLVNVVDYPEGKNELLDLLASYRKAVALPGEPLGVTSHVSHHIAMKPDTNPVYIPSYRLPHSQRAVVDGLVKDMLKEGVIQESTSPWSSPLFLVPKRDGSWRPVVAFRGVNEVTVSDHYPLSLLSDLLQSLGRNNTVFTSLDLLSGYWQIPLDKRSREISAFSIISGHFEFVRMPFRLKNAPLTFQRMINNLLAGLLGKDTFAYLDDNHSQ